MPQLIEASPYQPQTYDELIANHVVFREEMNEAFYLRALEQYEQLNDITLEHIVYESDGLNITGMRALPREIAGKSLPLLIFNRGGSGNYGALQVAFFMRSLLPYVRAGYGLLASNYRGNMGSDGKEEWGDGDIDDVLNLLELGKQEPWWDGKNSFMLGWSRGGMMTTMALRRQPPITAAACVAGVYDFHLAAKNRPEMQDKVYARYIKGWPESREDAFKRRSAIVWPEDINTPLLLLHGDADVRVDVKHSRMLATELQRLDKPYRYIEYEGGDHSLSQMRSESFAEIIDWFDTYRTAS